MKFAIFEYVYVFCICTHVPVNVCVCVRVRACVRECVWAAVVVGISIVDRGITSAGAVVCLS